ncbi:MAG: HDOD domain-containing protein [Gammaproteobacteria bacterium]|nr:HDOD domain-containing protein [Gammaproteobacteria bacterium]
MTQERARQEIQQQKELPTLSPNIEEILQACKDHDIDHHQLSKILEGSPTITARLLGLANSAFFGQQGRVNSLSHAISILGLVTVRSVTIGLVVSSVFDGHKCPNFRADRYWTSTVMTSVLAQELFKGITIDDGPDKNSVFVAGLLHNIGLIALVHLYPDEMNRAFTNYAANPEKVLAEHIQEQINTDHYQAGVWLGNKWHLPSSLLLVMEHHYDRDYRGREWALVQLEGVAARWANQIIDQHENLSDESDSFSALGITKAHIELSLQNTREKLDQINEMASLLAN